MTGIPPPIPGGLDLDPGGEPAGLPVGDWPDPHPMMSSAMSAQPTCATGGKSLLLFKFCQVFLKEKL
jgi:hypothetical protein